MDRNIRSILAMLVFILVWILCDVLYTNLVENAPYRFTISQGLIKPAVTYIVFCLIDRFFANRKR